MKNQIIVLIFAIVGNSLFAQTNQLISIQTRQSELVYSVDKNQKVYQVYFGEKLNDNAILSSFSGLKHEIYIPFGTSDLFETAIRTTHNDGNPSIDLQFVAKEVKILNVEDLESLNKTLQELGV